MTVIDISTLRRAGYNANKGYDAEFDVVGRNGVPAKEVLLKGLELGGRNDQRITLGPVLVYATDMSDTNSYKRINKSDAVFSGFAPRRVNPMVRCPLV